MVSCWLVGHKIAADGLCGRPSCHGRAWDRGEAPPVLAVALVVVGVVLRCLAPFLVDIQQDGATYSAMGHAWAQHGEFIMPWGDTIERFQSQPAYSHHYSPLYPWLLAAAYSVGGYSLLATKAVALVVSLASVAAVWVCSKNLFGVQRAAWVTALTAIEPGYVLATGTGFTENLILLLFTVTLWAILRSLQDPRYIVWAGLAAGLGYLTRSGMGVLFIIAGLGGLGWRLLYHGRKALRDPYYLGAAAIFGSMVAFWGGRNILRFGWPNWQTSYYATFSQHYALQHPMTLAAGLFFKIPLFLAFLYLYWMPLSLELGKARKVWRQENQSALWLSIALVVLIGWVMASVFWVVEASPIWWFDQHRYVLIAFLPLLWLAIQQAKPESRGFKMRAGILAGLLVASSVMVLAEPQKTPLADAALHMGLNSGDEVGLAGNLDKYKAYPYLSRYDVQVYDCDNQGTNAAWTTETEIQGPPCKDHEPRYILSTQRLATPGNYSLVRVSDQALFFGVTSIHAYTYEANP